MRKNILLLLISMLSILASCEKASFESYLNRKGLESLIKLKLYPNSYVLTADGKSEVSFLVQAFVEVRNGTRMDTVVYKLSEKDISQISIYSSEGEEIKNFTYKTNDLDRDKETFVAKLGDLQSDSVAVKIVPLTNNSFTKKVIPVNVYVLHNPLQEELANSVTDASLRTMFDRVNQVFANALVNAPHAMDTKIQFKFSRKIVKDVGNINVAELNKAILSNYTKQPEDTLHIWFCNTNEAEYSSLPKYKLDPNFNLQGLNLKHVESLNAITITNPKDVGILFPITTFNFIREGVHKIRLETYLGRFFGLLFTGSSFMPNAPASLDLDFCPDTYDYSNFSTGIVKQTLAYDQKNSLYFKSFNIMDDFSSATTISIDQVNRIRQVMEQCPYRQFSNK